MILPREYLFKTRREGNFATVGRRAHDLLGNIPPPLADTGASDDVLAVRPLVLAVLHSLYDLAEELREHSRPRGR